MLIKQHLFPVSMLLVVAALMIVYCGGSDEPTEPRDPLAGAALCLSDSSCTMGSVCDTSAAIDVTSCGTTAVLSWTATDDAPWLTLSVASGETPAQFCIMADSNRSGSERTATVTVTADDLDDESITVDVTQPSLEPTLCVSITDWEAYSLGDTSAPIAVINCGDVSSFIFQVSEGEDWLELPLTSGNTPWPFTIIADTNNTGAVRTGTVTVTADGVAGSPWEITVEQPPIVALAGSYDVPGSAADIHVSGDYAYVADGYDGVKVIDVSDPSNPSLAGTYVSVGFNYSVHVSGDYAYVANDLLGLLIIDVSNPSNPVFADCLVPPEAATSAHVSGNYAYVTVITLGLWVIDVSDPYDPVLAAWRNTPGWALGVDVSGDYAYVADYVGGLQVIDVSDPFSPDSVANCATPDVAYKVHVSGDYAYVVKEDDGLQIIDVSNPLSPTSVGNYNTPGSAWGVFVSGDYAYVADAGEGLHIIDVSDPFNPTLTATIDTPGNTVAVYISGDYAYVTSTGCLVTVLQLGL